MWKKEFCDLPLDNIHHIYGDNIGVNKSFIGSRRVKFPGIWSLLNDLKVTRFINLIGGI